MSNTALAQPRSVTLPRVSVGKLLAVSRVEMLAVGALVLLALGLNLFQIDRQGYGNTYYAAAVKSMLASWHDFFYASFDSGGFITVDKPPVGLWTQVLSARLLGFSGLSLFLPQVVAGVLSVVLLYHLVRRVYGVAAGTVAGAALALTPIFTITSRNNTMDSQLVLVLLLAGWAASLAAETGTLRWLLACAALVGLGFNIKMLQAYPVLPAFALMYLLWAPLRRRTRVGHLAVAGVVLLVVSLSWSLAVDLTSPDQRPYIGSSGSNSALSLALGYNGLGRLTQAVASQLSLPSLPGVQIDLSVAPGFAPQIGSPGIDRLFRPGVADEASWLLPLAAIGLLAAVWVARGKPSDQNGSIALQVRRERVATTLWGGWLLVWVAYFSIARFYHLYYLTMLGPAVAALSGVGAAALWRMYRSGGWAMWPLPLALALTGVLQVLMIGGRTGTPGLVVVACITLGVGAIATLTLLSPGSAGRSNVIAVSIGLSVLLVAPAAWTVTSILDGQGGAWLPEATGPRDDSGNGSGRGGNGGPRAGGFGAGGPGAQPGVTGSLQAGGPGFGAGPGGRGGALTAAGAQWNTLDPGLVDYLETHQRGAQYLVATPTSTLASVFMLATDQPVMALGGYQGWDKVVDAPALSRMVSNNVVRYFLLSGEGPRPGGSGDVNADLTDWVRAACVAVPSDEWQGQLANAGPGSFRGGPGGGGQALYDCGAVIG